MSDATQAGVAEALVRLYSRIGAEQRARLLAHLLTSVGPLALAVLAAGRFAKYMFRERWTELSVPVEEAAKLTESQFAEIARYVEQSDPTLLEHLVSLMVTDGGSLVVLGAGTMALLVRFIRERQGSDG